MYKLKSYQYWFYSVNYECFHSLIFSWRVCPCSLVICGFFLAGMCAIPPSSLNPSTPPTPPPISPCNVSFHFLPSNPPFCPTQHNSTSLSKGPRPFLISTSVQTHRTGMYQNHTKDNNNNCNKRLLSDLKVSLTVMVLTQCFGCCGFLPGATLSERWWFTGEENSIPDY